MARVSLLIAAGIAASSSIPAPALAQEDPRLSAIEAQIKALQGELARVRRDLAASRSEARAARTAQTAPPRSPAARPGPTPTPMQASAPSNGGADGLPQQTSSVAPPSTQAAAAPANPGGVSFPAGRPTFTSNDGRFSAAIGLQLHYDLGGEFVGTNNNAQPNRLDTFGQNLRRGRLPFVFKYDDFQVNVTPDFGGSPDGAPTLYEANVNYSPKGTPLAPLTVTLGYFKPWLTLGDSMSSNDFLFLERPSVVEASRNIAAGDGRSSFGGRWAANRYFVAGYLTGAPYASQNAALAQPQQTGGTLRLAGRPVATDDVDVHLGFSGSEAFRIQRSATGQTLTIQDRPELRIDTNRLVSTGALNASDASSYGPEFGFRWRNFMVQGEYVRIGVDRANSNGAAPTPSLTFDGGYVEGSWVITGEPRKYNVSEAAFGGPKVARPFSLKDGGIGAIEAVARYSRLNLNDRVTRGSAASVTGGVFGGEQTIYSVGVNWYPNDILRFMLDYDIINVDRLDAAGAKQIGRREQAVALRTQVAF